MRSEGTDRTGSGEPNDALHIHSERAEMVYVFNITVPSNTNDLQEIPHCVIDADPGKPRIRWIPERNENTTIWRGGNAP
jgi:hypothetical protein